MQEKIESLQEEISSEKSDRVRKRMKYIKVIKIARKNQIKIYVKNFNLLNLVFVLLNKDSILFSRMGKVIPPSHRTSS